MGELLNQPFRSESWDRLQVAQQAQQAKIEADRPDDTTLAILNTPIATGDALRSTRTVLNWSQQRLAEALGMSAPEISNMETGKKAVDERTDLAVRALVAMRQP